MSKKVIRVTLLALLPLLNACSAAPPPADCFLQVSLYDARGNSLPFKITNVTQVGKDPPINLAAVKESPLRLAPGAQRLLFPRLALGADLDMTLSLGEHETVKARVTLAECQQRLSIRSGMMISKFDTVGATVSGRLTGCTFIGDWWIRAMPMHGNEGIITDGYINPSDGSFRTPVATVGGRHILVIGKDKTPLKSVAYDVIAGEENDAGSIDLSGVYPK